MATEQVLPFSIASVVEDVLQQHGSRLSDIDLASRKAEEASLRRYEAARWLRKMVGVVGGKDLPAEPSEEDFRLGLRSGIILCNVLNKVQPGAVLKVVEGPSDSVLIPDGAALSAYQYFENVRNFLVAVEEMGLPTFEASDLEQGGKSARIVNFVLALKSYNDWKQGGGIGSWKFGTNFKPPTSGKYFFRKNSEPFANSVTRTSSLGEKSLDSLSSEDINEASSSHALHMLVHEALFDRRQEEIPLIVESMLSKVMEEFEHRLASQNSLIKTASRDMTLSGPERSLSECSADMKVDDHEEKVAADIKEEEISDHEEGSKTESFKQKMLVDRQQKDIQELKHTLYDTKAGMRFLQMKYQEEFNCLGKHLHGLAHAATGYQKVLEENRKLYNQVQNLKGNIRVYCRVRPFLPGQSNRASTYDHIDDTSIKIITPSKYGKEGRKSFSFNKVFGPFSTQEEVFSDTQPLIRSVLDGYNVCIFAYGQTGSGKTFTMTGPRDITEESQGVNYRALSDLFLLSEHRKDTISYGISVQMLEIYNEQVRDLLSMDATNKRLEIRNSSQNGINVPDANLVPVSSTSDVIYLMNLGHKNRSVSATAMNDRSSRSHSCLTVHVHGKDLTSGSILRGCMHLVDLAGSERVDKSEVTGDRLKEAQHINKSLSALGDVIASLAQKNSHVPYRNSKLTQLLQDSLGGQAKTLMFVHISPELEALGETLSTLKFAERVSTVELGAARVNKDSADVKELKEQIATLKAALARKEGQGVQLQHSQSLSPERFRVKSAGSSPLHSSQKSTGDWSGGCRQQLEDFGNIEVRKNTASKPKRRSLDLHDMLRSSPSWPQIGSPGLSGKEDDKDSVLSGDWIDKVMVNKQENASGEENLLGIGCWDVDNRQLPEMFGPSSLPDPPKLYMENQNFGKLMANKEESQDYEVQRSQYEAATTDDSDELEAATSDCSEPDMLWQLNPPKVTGIPNGLGAKPKKPYPRPVRSPETRSLIPSLIPSPSRKPPNGVSQPLHRTGRQAGPGEGKRRSGNAK
ncbi:kinesin-like protein KIN-14I isoform X1 [Prunus avium]|uniref:Kinesin-like protein KIN-14I isoform X1 n=1 Tax=Prunus avium TaxID=42229 RepID=A0A6P5SWN9_PRUAV|nr:kinesin-like protein KIN-14I isoform X1 [Prunus avium]